MISSLAIFLRKVPESGTDRKNLLFSDQKIPCFVNSLEFGICYVWNLPEGASKFFKF